ncbi:hypothetical protein ACTFIR_006787 [Dictyostelium discoideum]
MDYLNSYLKIRDSIIDSINKKKIHSNIFSLIDLYDNSVDNIKINGLMNFLYFPNKVSCCREAIDNDEFDNINSRESGMSTTIDSFINTPIIYNDDYEEDHDEDHEDIEGQENKINKDETTFCTNNYIYNNFTKCGKIYSPNFNELLKIATSINNNDNYKIIENHHDLVIPMYNKNYLVNIDKSQFDFIKLHIFKKTNNNITKTGVNLDRIQQENQKISKWVTVENGKRFFGKLFAPIGYDGDEIEIRHNRTKIFEKISISKSGMFFDYYKYLIKYCILPDNDITVFINSNNRNQYFGLLEFDMFSKTPHEMIRVEPPSIESIGFRNIAMKMMKIEFDKLLNKGNYFERFVYNL